MQTPKARTSLDIPQRKSPGTTPRTTRQLKPSPKNDSDTVPSPGAANKTPKDQSPKVIKNRSPRSPASEKKRPGKVFELEAQLAQLQEDLKKAKEQMNAFESSKRQAQKEAEEAKKQLSVMSEKLEESEQQLIEISASEDSRILELRKISQDRDRVWQSELEAVRKQHAMDSAALASSMNEIQKLKVQLEKAYESEVFQANHADSAYDEIQNLRSELSETISLVEKMKSELTDCRESEARALDMLSDTQMQLATQSATVEMLRSEGSKAKEAYNALSFELEQSNARVRSLEGLVSKLQAELVGVGGRTLDVQKDDANGMNEEITQLKAELNFAKLEATQLRSALDAAEVKYQEEYIRSTLQIRNAYEQVERIKTESSQREKELETELKKSKFYVEDLKGILMEYEIQSNSEGNESLDSKIQENVPNERETELEMEMKKVEANLAKLKVNLSDKEIELKNVTEQNEKLRMEIESKETANGEVTSESIKAANNAEQRALMKLDHLTDEADKSSRRVAHVTEQLDAAQAANAELEAQLRRLKVQADQWRKAAEAAAAMLSPGNNVRDSPIIGNLGSPNSEDMDDDSPKKKNGNMLKKIGVLWKKGQK